MLLALAPLVALVMPSVAQAADGTVFGLVVNQAGQPVSDVCVTVENAAQFGVTYPTVTDSSGAYQSSVPAGQYTVGFSGCDPSANWVAQWYPDRPEFGEAQPVSVLAGQTTGGINATMAVGAQITGRLIDPTTGVAPSGEPSVAVELPGVSDAQPAIGPEVDPTPLAADGSFDVDQLPAGTYLVVFEGCYCNSNAIWYYPHAPDPGHAARVTVTAGQTVSVGVVTDEHWGTVSGRVTQSGTPVALTGVYPAMIEPDGSLYLAPGVTVATDGTFDDTTVPPGSWQMMAAGGLGQRGFSPTLAVGSGTTITGVNIVLPASPTPPPPSRVTIRLRSARARVAGGVLTLTARFLNDRSGSAALSFTGRHRHRRLIYRVKHRFEVRHGTLRLRIKLPRRYRKLASPTAHLTLHYPGGTQNFTVRVRG